MEVIFEGTAPVGDKAPDFEGPMTNCSAHPRWNSPKCGHKIIPGDSVKERRVPFYSWCYIRLKKKIYA